MSTCYLVRDMNGKPATSVQVTAEYNGRKIAAVSGADAVARFSEDIPDSAKVYAPGFSTVTKVPCLQAPPVPAPQPPEETPGFGVGTSCKIYSFRLPTGELFFRVRDQRGNQVGQAYVNEKDAYAFAVGLPQCNERPQPTVQEWQQQTTLSIAKGFEDLKNYLKNGLDGITGYLAGIDQTLQDIVSGAEQEAQAWRKAYDSIWDKLEDWLVERILRILEKALDIEVTK